MNPQYYTQPNIGQIRLPQQTSYSSNLSGNAAISKILNTLGSYLKPTPSPTQTLNYDTFAAPVRAVNTRIAQEFTRPQFETNTLQPFKQDASYNAAINNSFAAGNFKPTYQRDLNKLELGYNEQLGNQTSQLEGLINEAYQRQISAMGNAPTLK